MKQMPLQVFTDGGARGNPGPSSTGFVVKIGTQTIHKEGKYIGVGTNNQAEYQAVIEALNWLIQNEYLVTAKTTQILFHLDSLLVVNQLNGKYKVKNPELKKLLLQIRIIEAKVSISINYFCFIVYLHIPRKENTEADSLVNEALDKNV